MKSVDELKQEAMNEIVAAEEDRVKVEIKQILKSIAASQRDIKSHQTLISDRTAELKNIKISLPSFPE